MRDRAVLFDLDGTLTDPAEGITKSVQHALKRFGISVPDRRKLFCFIGPPLLETFEKEYGLSGPQLPEALKAYREYFTDRGIFENKVYPGIPAMLERLQKAGYRLFVATSKPEEFSVRILEHFGLARYFAYIGGCTLDEKRTHKDEVIRYVLDTAGIDASNAVMVGDRDLDIVGAKKCGLRAAGVLYGYGSREELERAGAEFLAETPAKLADWLCGGPQR